MKKFSIIFLLLVLTSTNLFAQARPIDEAIKDLANQIVLKMNEYGKKKILIPEFTDLKGNKTDFGKYLKEQITNELQNLHALDIIDEIEQTQESSSITDAVLSVGKKIISNDATLNGTYSVLAISVKLNAKMLVSGGKVFSTASSEAIMDENVKALLGIKEQKQLQQTVIKDEIPTSSNAPTNVSKPVQSQSSGTLLFSDDFRRSDMGQWKVICGDWAVADGEVFLLNRNARFGSIGIGDASWTNYTVEFEAEALDADYGFGLGFYADEYFQSCHQWAFGWWSLENFAPVLVNFKNVCNGEYTEFEKDAFRATIIKNQWHKIKVVVKPGYTEAYFDNKPPVKVTDPVLKINAKGGIMLTTYSSHCSFKNLRVYKN